jgi:hypothetical protein
MIRSQFVGSHRRSVKKEGKTGQNVYISAKKICRIISCIIRRRRCIFVSSHRRSVTKEGKNGAK